MGAFLRPGSLGGATAADGSSFTSIYLFFIATPPGIEPLACAAEMTRWLSRARVRIIYRSLSPSAFYLRQRVNGAAGKGARALRDTPEAAAMPPSLMDAIYIAPLLSCHRRRRALASSLYYRPLIVGGKSVYITIIFAADGCSRDDDMTLSADAGHGDIILRALSLSGLYDVGGPDAVRQTSNARHLMNI